MCSLTLNFTLFSYHLVVIYVMIYLTIWLMYVRINLFSLYKPTYTFSVVFYIMYPIPHIVDSLTSFCDAWGQFFEKQKKNILILWSLFCSYLFNLSSSFLLWLQSLRVMFSSNLWKHLLCLHHHHWCLTLLLVISFLYVQSVYNYYFYWICYAEYHQQQFILFYVIYIQCIYPLSNGE